MSLLLGLTLGLTPAYGHAGEAVQAIDVVCLPGADRVDVELSVGLVLIDEDLRWVCHEAITAAAAEQAPRYRRSADGSWLAWLRDPAQGREGHAVWRSTDGCSWEPAAGLDGLGAIDGAFDPTEASHALLVAREADGDTLLVESFDGGRSFAPVDDLPSREVAGVRFGVDGTAWVGRGGTQPGVLTRAAGGSWIPHELPGLAAEVWIAAVSTVDPRHAWVVEDDVADRVFQTADGGATWTEVPGVDGEVIDATPDGAGGAWLLLDGARLRNTKTGDVRNELGLGVGVAGHQVWHASNPEFTRWMVQEVTDEGLVGTWAPADVAGPLACPASSDVARVCTPLWDELADRMAEYDGPLPPSPADDSGLPVEGRVELEPGCGCRTGSGALGAWWLLPLGLLWRRR